MLNDWTHLVEAFALGAFPWISQLKQLKIHFEMDDLDAASIFNFFASLFALGIYCYFAYAHPSQVMGLPNWYMFILLALTLTAAFFANFLWHRTKVVKDNVKWPVLVGFVLYIGIFSSLTAGFGLLRILENYIVVKGVVEDASSHEPLDRCDVEVSDQRDYQRSAKTDHNGRFLLLVERKNFDTLSRAIVNKAGYEEEQITFSGGFATISSMNLIEMQLASTKGK